MKRIFLIALSFAIATILVGVANFLLQIVLIFTDIVTRMESSSALVIVLWTVTGVFGTVFAVAAAEQLIGKQKDVYAQVGNVILLISLLAIIFAVFFLSQGLFRRDPKEFSLLFSNGYVFISYFAGAGAMALIMRKLD